MKWGPSDSAMQLEDVPRISASRRLGSAGRPAPERRSRQQNLGAETGKAALAERAEPNALEEFARPALLMGQIAELAGHRAKRTLQRAGRTKCEKVGQSQEMRSLE